MNQLTSSVTGLKAQLNSYRKDFQQGLKNYTDAASAIADKVTTELQPGASSLNDGMQQLLAGIGELKTKSSELPNGVSRLKNGAMQLSDGMKTLSGEDGIGKLIDLYNNGALGLVNRLRALKEASTQYTSFVGSADNTPCSVKFIYRTDSISVPEDNGGSSPSSGSN